MTKTMSTQFQPIALLTLKSQERSAPNCWESYPQFSQSMGALDIEAGAPRPLRLARSQGLDSASV